MRSALSDVLPSSSHPRREGHRDLSGWEPSPPRGSHFGPLREPFSSQHLLRARHRGLGAGGRVTLETVRSSVHGARVPLEGEKMRPRFDDGGSYSGGNRGSHRARLFPSPHSCRWRSGAGDPLARSVVRRAVRCHAKPATRLLVRACLVPFRLVVLLPMT